MLYSLKLDPISTDIGLVFAPVELEGITRLENQRHVSSTSCSLFRTVPIFLPRPRECGNPAIGSLIPQLHQISMHPLTVRRSLRGLRVCASSQADNRSAYGSNLLERGGVLNCGSTAPSRRYFLMVLRDSPVRREISRIGILSRNAQRRMTLKNPMSITPNLPKRNRWGNVFTWVNSQ